jgi:hypothetical protein
VFGNAVREFALSIGKENVFTFGEVYDSEAKIARFIGRNAGEQGDLVGVDAALDFPVFFTLPAVAKGMAPPLEIARLYEDRKRIQRDVVSSHGEAGRFFVTFLDNHDQHTRFRHEDPLDPARFDDQVTLALGCLFALQGIPCVYYGTEQGLSGSGSRPEAVREALWGKPDGFDLSHPVARVIRNLTTVRGGHPALRFGRQYFRPISGDGIHFGVSPFPGGVVAFSRILNDREVLVAANTNTTAGWAGQVLVDRWLNPAGRQLDVVFTNQPGTAVRPAPVLPHLAGTVEVEGSGGGSTGPIHAVPVALGPMEVQFLA